jgi:hypothetical protein
MRFIINNRFIQFNIESITKIIYNEDDGVLRIYTGFVESLAVKISIEDYKKILSYFKISLNVLDISELTEDENELKEMEIKNLNEKIKKLQFELENNLTLTGSVDTRTLINLDNRLKILEDQLINKDAQ